MLSVALLTGTTGLTAADIDLGNYELVKKLDFTTATYEADQEMTLDTAKIGTAWETGNKKQQIIYNVSSPAELSGTLALQAVMGSKGWWLRSTKGGLWCYNANRSGAVYGMAKGNIVVFKCTQNASKVITLANGEGNPDGPFTYSLSDDQLSYYCTLTDDGNVGFCGAKSQGYIESISIYKPIGNVTFAKYTLEFIDETGKSIKAPATYEGIAGQAVAYPSSAKDPVYIYSDSAQTVKSGKFVFYGDNAADVTIAADGSTVVTLLFRKAANWNYTITAVNAEGALLKELKTGTTFEGETESVGYNAYLPVDGILYTAGKSYSADGKGYTMKLDITEDNLVKQITYTATDKAGVVFFSEAEDIAGFVPCTNGNTGIRSSNAQSAYADSTKMITTLDAGIYKLTSVACDAAGKNASAVFNYLAGQDTIFTHTCASINWDEQTSGEFTLTKKSAISLAQGGKATQGIDLIYIQKVGDVAIVSDSVFINFNDSAYAVSSASSTAGDITEDFVITNNGLTTTITPGISGTPNRFWAASGKPQLRVYSGYIRFNAAEGKAIKSIELTTAKWNKENTLNGEAAEVGKWEGNSTNVELKIAANTQINKITAVIESADEATSTYAQKAEPLPVVDSIGQFKALPVKTEARLNLNYKTNQVVFANSKVVVIQDESKDRIMLYNIALDVKANDILTGSIAGTYSPYNGLPEMIANDSTDVSTVVATAGDAIKADALASVSKAKDPYKILKLCSLSNVELTTVDGKSYLQDATGSIQLYDALKAEYTLLADTMLKSITGIVTIIVNETDTTYQFAPIGTEAVEYAVPQYYKSFTETTIFVPTAENVEAGKAEGAAWIEGGATRVDNKTLKLDLTTDTEMDTKSAPGVGLKSGNANKTFVTYVTGIDSVYAYGTSTSSSATRQLKVTATTEEGEAITGQLTTTSSVTALVKLALNKDLAYKIEYTGLDEAGTAGADVALHGIKFIVKTDIANSISNISTSNAAEGSIYSVSGQKVRNAGEPASGLAKGIYIIDGKKVIIK